MKEETKYPIGGYAPGSYQRKCSTCDTLFMGNREAFQCEPCAIKDKEFYDSLTPEGQRRFDNRFSEIAKLFFENLDLQEQNSRLRKALEELKYWYLEVGKGNVTMNYDVLDEVDEALKQQP